MGSHLEVFKQGVVVVVDMIIFMLWKKTDLGAGVGCRVGRPARPALLDYRSFGERVILSWMVWYQT